MIERRENLSFSAKASDAFGIIREDWQERGNGDHRCSCRWRLDSSVLLAAVGIYGVLTYLVAHRTKEIGIRMALGSTHRGVFRLIMQEGLLLITLGFGVGAGGLLALKRSLQSLLFGVTAGDPVVLLSVIGMLGCIGLACAIPARRATRIDPVPSKNSVWSRGGFDQLLSRSADT